MSTLFRNIDVSPDAPVDSWGVEGILAALDRGEARHWARIARAVAADPDLEADFEQAASLAGDTGAVAAVRAAIERRRRSPRDEAFDLLQDLFLQTGLTQAEVAARLDTSQSRLSTYLGRKVMPSAATLIALRRLAEARSM